MRNGSIVLRKSTLNLVLPRLTKKSLIIFFLLYLTAVVAQKLGSCFFNVHFGKKLTKVNEAHHTHSSIPLPLYDLVDVLVEPPSSLQRYRSNEGALYILLHRFIIWNFSPAISPNDPQATLIWDAQYIHIAEIEIFAREDGERFLSFFLSKKRLLRKDAS